MKTQLLALAALFLMATSCGQNSNDDAEAKEAASEEKMVAVKKEAAKNDEKLANIQAEIDKMTAPSSVKLAISGMTSEKDGQMIKDEVIALDGVLNGMCDTNVGIAKFGYDGAVIHFEKIIEHIDGLEGSKFKVNDHGVNAGVPTEF